MGIVNVAIKAQHRLTEEDRFTGLPTEGGNPGGVQAAEGTKPIHPARTISNPKSKAISQHHQIHHSYQLKHESTSHAQFLQIVL